MIKRLLFVMLFAISGINANAQFDNIGLLGGSTTVGWTSDMDMATTDGIVYTLNNVVLTNPPSGGDSPGVKFRKDDAWATNWGGNSFPNGTAVLNGGDILVANGTYNVTFNKNTLQYSFVNVLAFQPIAILGLFNAWVDMPMTTLDGENYTLQNYTFTSGGVKFRIPGSWNTNWGGPGFPTGTGVQGGTDIPLVAGTYNVNFNRITGAYAFNYVTISIIGDAAAGWTTDVPMTTTDGVTYTLPNYALTTGEMKFRLNNSFGAGNWGGSTFPSGTGVYDGPNLQVTTAGTYDITFNRSNATYTFVVPTAGVTDFAKGRVTVYPNPSASAWNFITNDATGQLTITDVSGKTVYSSVLSGTETNVNSSAFGAGMYFARVTSGNATEVIRLVKK